MFLNVPAGVAGASRLQIANVRYLGTFVKSSAYTDYPLEALEADWEAPTNYEIGKLAISPDGRHLYWPGYAAGAIAVFERDGASGRLTQTAVVPTESESGKLTAGAIVVSSDGRHVYVGGLGSPALLGFERDAESGGLTQVWSLGDSVEVTTEVTNALAASPDGAHVYATLKGQLAAFERDSLAGVLIFAGGSEEPSGKTSLAVIVAVHNLPLAITRASGGAGSRSG